MKPTPARARLLGIVKALGFVLALNVFFVAIKLLGAFKDIGSGMGETMMAELATRPVLGLLLGILVTSIIQSSSTTTSLVVGLAASGVFGDSPEQAMQAAVPLIMGANIGTTVTNTIVSFGHVGDNQEFRRAFAAATIHDVFNFMTVLVLLPIQVATNFLGIMSTALANALDDVGGLRLVSPLKMIIDPQASAFKHLFDHQPITDFVVIAAIIFGVMATLRYLTKRQVQEKRGRVHFGVSVVVFSLAALLVKTYHEFLFTKPVGVFVAGLGLLLGTLWVMVTIMRSVVLVRAQRLFHDYLLKTPARALIIGLLLTALVQSSSVTTSLIVPLAGAGLVTLAQVFPYALGANLGTTVTAFIAALSLGEPVALAVALAHLFFNMFGIILIYPLTFVRKIPMWVADKLAAGAVTWKFLPVAYVLGLYVLLPVVLIWLGG